MFLFFLALSINPIFAACVWYTPSVIFPKNLVHLDSPLFHKQRRLSPSDVTKSNAATDVSGGASMTSDNDGNTLVRDGGLDNQGRVQYSVMYDASVGVPSLEYRLESITPLNVGPKPLPITTALVNIDHTLSDALAFEETLVVTISAWSSCLPLRALSETSYSFNVTASYELFYNHTNQLSPHDNANIVSIQVRRSNSTHKFVATPCLDTYIQSSIDVLNTSSHTEWLPGRWPGDNATRMGGGTPRCHLRDHGSVCTVVALARFKYGKVCSRPVTFSLWQAVSQVSRQHHQLQFPNTRPENFDAHRREPIADGPDMRYDMCEARVCSGEGCTPMAVQNDAVALAGNINLNQSTSAMAGVLEMECRFEVVGFMDDLWSPYIYFRQAVGFDVHHVQL